MTTYNCACASRRYTLGVLCTLLAAVFALLGSGAASQQREKDTRKQLMGTWLLISAQNEKKADIFGPHPTGMLVFDASGHFSSQVMRGDLPKLASSDRTKAGPEESQAVIRGYIAYFGTYSVTAPGALTLHILGGSFPNWNGADQKRAFAINGDEMQYTNLVTSFGGASAHLRWRRASAGR
jgi:hypothetical protein